MILIFIITVFLIFEWNGINNTISHITFVSIFCVRVAVYSSRTTLVKEYDSQTDLM